MATKIPKWIPGKTIPLRITEEITARGSAPSFFDPSKLFQLSSSFSFNPIENAMTRFTMGTVACARLEIANPTGSKGASLPKI